jgi:peroxiredoxin
MIELALALLLSQQEKPGHEIPAGHSAHGDAFNEGPRQRAYLLPGQGDVAFPVSSTSAEARSFFTQGVAQLHSFYYFEAERSFRQAAQLDPGLAMAYWGMAMANVNNEKRAKAFIEKAVALLDRATPREQAWIRSTSAYYKEAKGEKRSRAYVKALEAIVADHPDDLEAKAFLAWAIWHHKDKGLPINSHTAVDALLGEILRANPLHPGAHHYRIHLWDGEKPDRALSSVPLYGPSAAGIAHAWHMPGHIYSKLKRYGEAAEQQEASARVDHLQMIRDRTMPYQIHNYVHNNQWLMQDLGYVGRVREAVAVGDNLIEIPRHPKLNKVSDKSSAGREGRSRLFEILVAWELWKELLDRENGRLEALEADEDAVRRHRALGAAAYATGDLDRGDRHLAGLDAVAAKAAAEKDAKKRDEALKPVRNALAELRGRRASALGEARAALADLSRAADLRKDVLARAQLAAGLGDQAEETARAAAKASEGQALPQAALAEILLARGKTEEARSAHVAFLAVARDADPDLPVIGRLRGGLPGHMPKLPPRKPAVENPGVLGPLAWHPAPAPAASLPGLEPGLSPALLIFYLGAKCSHCVQQLDAFAKHADAFKALGLPIVAVSAESPAELESGSRGRWPFPLHADPGLTLFKAWRCHDDFENVPLHGTFVVDAGAHVRWQDVSYEPFTDAAFLLAEAKRLLAFRPPPGGW